MSFIELLTIHAKGSTRVAPTRTKDQYMTKRFNFTKKIIEGITAPNDGKRLYYYDSKVQGLTLSITEAGTKSFMIYKKVNGKPIRHTLGRFPAMTVEQARREGLKVLSQIVTGVDTIKLKKAMRTQSVTLHEVFEDFLEARKSLKPVTIHDYKRVMKEAFADWQKRPLLKITKDMVANLHRQLGSRSKARANIAMRVLRALFNFAAGEYEDENGKSLILENPVSRLSHTRAWYRVERRKTVIKAYDLQQWYQAVLNVRSEFDGYKGSAVCDYLLLILFTGLRRTEAATLRWENIDFKAKSFTVLETKNHEQHTLPLSNFLYDLLMKRYEDAYSEFVFPGDGKRGYIIEPRKTMNKIIEKSGVNFTLHDLRRTFITIAESLDIPAYALKRLLNHKMNFDVTAGYIITDVERLRKPMQIVTDFLLEQMNLIANKIKEKVINAN